eukprot:TRINITY_DN26086_c0_g1_i1.p1 TRINITY_DN26086_c0_g1~~TRINITY_DN26086_c0_g1_i1.p1  ORF type:complete len:143 (+),score=27.67 TRINITY_DN26086_c0_g1_i1:124-552(+)
MRIYCILVADGAVGPCVRIDLEPGSTFSDVARLLEDKEGISRDFFQLVYRPPPASTGLPVKEDALVEEYNLQESNGLIADVDVNAVVRFASGHGTSRDCLFSNFRDAAIDVPWDLLTSGAALEAHRQMRGGGGSLGSGASSK